MSIWCCAAAATSAATMARLTTTWWTRRKRSRRFYRRFGCELVQQSDGYFYLLPSGDRLGRRQLSAGEMLVGQTLALLYLDPATLQHGGVVGSEALLQRLAGSPWHRCRWSAR